MKKIANSYHHGDLKSALLDAAMKLLKKRSPNEISLRELARIAGVSHAASYRYFKDKDDLLAELARLALLRNMVVYCQRHKVFGEGDPLHIAFHCWSVVNGFTSLYADGSWNTSV